MPTTDFYPQNKETASAVLDRVLEDQKLRNDARLAAFLDTTPPQISKVRHGHLPMTAAMILRIHLKTNIKADEIVAALRPTEEVTAA